MYFNDNNSDTYSIVVQCKNCDKTKASKLNIEELTEFITPLVLHIVLQHV